MRKGSVAVGTWPQPERPSTTVEIPIKFLEEFKVDARVVVRHPWIVGIPLNEVLLRKLIGDRGLYKELIEEFDVMLVPK